MPLRILTKIDAELKSNQCIHIGDTVEFADVRM